MAHGADWISLEDFRARPLEIIPKNESLSIRVFADTNEDSLSRVVSQLEGAEFVDAEFGGDASRVKIVEAVFVFAEDPDAPEFAGRVKRMRRVIGDALERNRVKPQHMFMIQYVVDKDLPNYINLLVYWACWRVEQRQGVDEMQFSIKRNNGANLERAHACVGRMVMMSTNSALQMITRVGAPKMWREQHEDYEVDLFTRAINGCDVLSQMQRSYK